MNLYKATVHVDVLVAADDDLLCERPRGKGVPGDPVYRPAPFADCGCLPCRCAAAEELLHRMMKHLEHQSSLVHNVHGEPMCPEAWEDWNYALSFVRRGVYDAAAADRGRKRRRKKRLSRDDYE